MSGALNVGLVGAHGGGADRQIDACQAAVLRAIGTVYDPEIAVDVYQLGLIYDVFVTDERDVRVKMTLTSPACFAAQVLPGEIRVTASRVPGVGEAQGDSVGGPPWRPGRKSEAGTRARNQPWRGPGGQGRGPGGVWSGWARTGGGA